MSFTVHVTTLSKCRCHPGGLGGAGTVIPTCPRCCCQPRVLLGSECGGGMARAPTPRPLLPSPCPSPTWLGPSAERPGLPMVTVTPLPPGHRGSALSPPPTLGPRVRPSGLLLPLTPSLPRAQPLCTEQPLKTNSGSASLHLRRPSLMLDEGCQLPAALSPAPGTPCHRCSPRGSAAPRWRTTAPRTSPARALIRQSVTVSRSHQGSSCGERGRGRERSRPPLCAGR